MSIIETHVDVDTEIFATLGDDSLLLLKDLKLKLEWMNNSTPCKELQLALMDVESLAGHLFTLKETGPSAPYEVVGLEESEIGEGV